MHLIFHKCHLNVSILTIGAYHPDIVVVTEKKPELTTSGSQSELNKLRHVPLFYPILKSSIGLSDDQKLLQISPEHLIKLSSHLQHHLNTCAFNVTKDQEAVTAEIKNVNKLKASRQVFCL